MSPAANDASRPSGFLDRDSDQVAPFGPGSVVVLDVVEPEEVLEREPGEARPLADAAIRDDRLIAGDSLRAVERSQLVKALERAVVVAVLAPRNALGAGNVAAALAGFGQSGRRQDLAGEFLRAADIDERRRFRLHGLLHFRQEGAQRVVGRFGLVLRVRKRWLVGAELPPFGQPLLAPAVHDPDVVVAVDLQLPEGPRRKPVVVVAVEHDRGP